MFPIQQTGNMWIFLKHAHTKRRNQKSEPIRISIGPHSYLVDSIYTHMHWRHSRNWKKKNFKKHLNMFFRTWKMQRSSRIEEIRRNWRKRVYAQRDFAYVYYHRMPKLLARLSASCCSSFYCNWKFLEYLTILLCILDIDEVLESICICNASVWMWMCAVYTKAHSLVNY